MAVEVLTNAPYAVAGQDVWHQTVNDQVNHLAWNGVVKNTTTTDPSGLAPNEGEAWYVAASAIGDWLGHDGEIALYYSGWIFRPFGVGEKLTSLVGGSGASGFSRWHNVSGTLTQIADPD